MVPLCYASNVYIIWHRSYRLNVLIGGEINTIYHIRKDCSNSQYSLRIFLVLDFIFNKSKGEKIYS